MADEIRTVEDAISFLCWEGSLAERDPMSRSYVAKLDKSFELFLGSGPSKPEFGRVMNLVRLTPGMLYEIWKGHS